MQNATRRVGRLLPVKVYTSSEICSYLDITSPYLTKLVADKVLAFAKNDDGEVVNGRFHLRDTVRAYIKYILQRVKDKPSSAAAFDQARTRRMAETAKTAQIKNAIITGTVYLAKDVDQILSEKITWTKNRLLAFPAQLVRMTEGMDNEDEKIRIGQQMMYDCLVDLSVPTSEEVRSRDRKLQEFGEVFNTDGDEDDEPEVKRGRGRPRKQEEMLV